MQFDTKQLMQHLAREALLPAYLIASDVFLLAQEARDAIYHTAQRQGFQQRKLLLVDNSTDRTALAEMFNNFNLFGEKTFLEIRCAQDQWKEDSTQILLRYLAHPPEDQRLIILTHKLSTNQQKTAWYKAIKTVGAIITLWPINLRELPRWITERLQQKQLTANSEAVRLLAELTEGNLLSTQQAIEKLSLLYPDKRITVDAVWEVIHDHARFHLFDLTQSALNGSVHRVLRIVSSLRLTGTEPALVLWVLTRELRELHAMLYQKQQGRSLAQILETYPTARKSPLQNALQRLSYHDAGHLLQQAKEIDFSIKGIHSISAWEALENLSLAIAK